LKKLRCDWSVCFMDIKAGTHNSVIDDAQGSYYDGTGSSVSFGIDIGEQARDLKCTNVICIIGPECTDSVSHALGVNGRRIHFEGVLANLAESSTTTGTVA